MSPNQARLYFAERVDEWALLDYCTRKLCARVVDGSDLRWSGDDAAVVACDVRGTLAGDFVVPDKVTACLGAAPKSAIVLDIGEHPSSHYVVFLVTLALLRQWSGCVAVPGDLLMLSSQELMDRFGDHRPLRSVSGDGSRR